MNDRYQGKRFWALIFVALLLTLAFFFGPAASYGAFATSLAGAYAVYCGGQSATDYQKAKNGRG